MSQDPLKLKCPTPRQKIFLFNTQQQHKSNERQHKRDEKFPLTLLLREKNLIEKREVKLKA